MKARDVMVPDVITVSLELDVKAVANTLVTNGISGVPVVDANRKIVGIISEGDLMRRVVLGPERKRSRWLEIFSPDEQWAEFAKLHGRKAKDVMTRPVITVENRQQPGLFTNSSRVTPPKTQSPNRECP